MKEVFVKDQVICVTGILLTYPGGGDGGRWGEEVVFFCNFIRE